MKKSPSSSFRNKASNVVNIPGTKVSVCNAQLLTSTGSSTLDFFLGGGLAIGTICAIEEDRYNSYASLLMKYFLAEGATRKHSLFLAGGDKDPKEFLKELPAAKGVETSSSKRRYFDEQYDCSKLTRRLQDQSLRDEFPATKSTECCSDTKPTFDGLYDSVKIAMGLLGQSSKVESPVAKAFPFCSNIESGVPYDPVNLAMGLLGQSSGAGPPAYRSVECCSDGRPNSEEPYDPVKIAMGLLGQSYEAEPPAHKSVECCSDTKCGSGEPYDPIKIALGLLGQASKAESPVAKAVPFCSNIEPTSEEPYDPIKIAMRLLARASEAEPPASRTVPFCSNIGPISDEPYDPINMEMRLKAQAAGVPLPAAKNSKCSSNPNGDDSLKIAWRYQSQSIEDDVKAESYNMGFDLTKAMPYEEIEKCSVSTWIPTDSNPDEPQTNFLKMPYLDLLRKMKQDVESQGLKTSAKNAESILRIGINSIGSPLWRTGNNEEDDLNLLRFLFALKAHLRTSFAVAVITVPSFLFSNLTLMNRIRQICDTVIALESFVGSDKMSNPLFKDFDGLLHIEKLPVLNTFTYPSMTEDLAFKLKKRGLIIERLHLPPELGDPTPEQQQQLGCSGLGKKLDF